MIAYVIESGIYLAVLYLAYGWLFEKEVFHTVNRWLLLSMAVMATLLPALPPIFTIRGGSELFAVQLPSILVGGAADPVVQSASDSGFDLSQVVFWLFVVGSTLVVINAIRGLRHLRAIKRSSDVVHLYGKRVLISNEVKHPFSFMKDMYLPSVHNFEEKEIKKVLDHEAAHIELGHSMDNMLLQCLQLIQWWNPFYYLLRQALRNVHEYQADEVVVRKTTVNDYGYFLLKSTQTPNLPLFATSIFSHPLKKRIVMMKKRRVESRIKKYLFLLPLMIGIMAIHSCTDDESNSFTEETNKEGTQKEVTSEPTTYTQVDTIFTFDPETKKEEMKIVKSEEDVFKVVEEMPRFPGCEEVADEKEKSDCATKKMLEYIYSNIKYPKLAKEEGVEGTAVIQFIVDKQGYVREAQIVRNPGGGTGEEALKVVNSMASENIQWNPGMQSGKNVNVQFTLPVKFKLQ